jgi:hypothetical protein
MGNRAERHVFENLECRVAHKMKDNHRSQQRSTDNVRLQPA